MRGDFLKALNRNQQTFYYCLFQEKIPVVDEYGNETSEYIVRYGTPTEMTANISPATGYSQTEQFGNLDNYDKVIVTTDMDCPIDENSVLFIEKEVEYTDAETVNYTPSDTVLGDDEVETVTVQVPVYDYVVRRVAKSLNSISIAVRKVDVS